jgi:hypothetical protein
MGEPGRHAAQSAPPQRLAAGLALGLGVLLLWLALPRLMAAAWLALRDPVIHKMNSEAPVAHAELFGLIASRELALSWALDRETQAELGTALAELAFREEPAAAARKAALERAVRALEAGLAAAPGSPKDWMQLGYLLLLLEGDPNRKAAEALLLSIRTGPFQTPELLQRRLFWSLAHWAFYDREERREIGDQIRLAWRVAPGELADLALQAPDFVDPIASALAEAPGARAQFVAALAIATASTEE